MKRKLLLRDCSDLLIIPLMETLNAFTSQLKEMQLAPTDATYARMSRLRVPHVQDENDAYIVVSILPFSGPPIHVVQPRYPGLFFTRKVRRYHMLLLHKML